MNNKGTSYMVYGFRSYMLVLVKEVRVGRLRKDVNAGRRVDKMLENAGDGLRAVYSAEAVG